MSAIASRETNAGLAVSNLRVRYKNRGGELPVVNGVSLTLRPGEAIGIVGESGSGKSTLALAIAGLLRPDEAAVSASALSFDGIDMRGMPETARTRLLGKRVGFVFQNPHVALNPVLRIGRQLTDHMVWHLHLSHVEAETRAGRLLEEVGIADTRNRLQSYPHEFSGGMLQRVTIAMALACDPDLLIADEPTTALDASVQADIVELIAEIRIQRHLSLIWITHDLALLRRIVDRVAVMYAGRVIEIGVTDAVYAQPTHPYTRALLASIASLWANDSGPFLTIEGTPPAAGKPVAGCAFRPRCPLGFAACVEVPELTPRRPGSEAACWAPDVVEPGP